MKTFTASVKDVCAQWYVVDAADKRLGKLAAELAHRLRGKHKPEYSPHLDVGDYVIVLNAEKIQVSGKKAEQKTYYKHSGYVGSLKTTSFEKLLAAHPERVLQHAVKGMLPKGPLGRAMFKKLKVCVGNVHPHEAQQPIELKL